MTQLTTYQIRRKIEAIKEQHDRVNDKTVLILHMWQPNRGDGKPGFCSFNTRTPHIKMPEGE